MFGLGIWEIAVVVVVGLIVLGPRRLPEIARQLGRGLREFRRAAHEFQASMEEAANLPDDIKEPLTELPPDEVFSRPRVSSKDASKKDDGG